MKVSSYVAVASAVFCGVQATTSTTVVCSACPSISSTVDVVTRSAVPTTPCTAPALTIVSHGSTSQAGNKTTSAGSGGLPTSTAAPSATLVPVAAGGKVVGSVGGALALAMGVVCLV